MDYIDTLLIMEDDLDENPEDSDLGEFGESAMTVDNNDPPEQDPSRDQTQQSSNNNNNSLYYKKSPDTAHMCLYMIIDY